MIKGTIIYIGGFELPDKNAAAQRVVSNAKLLREIGYKVVLIGIHKTTKIEKEQSQHYGFECYSIQYPESKIDWFKYITEFKFYKDISEKNQNIHSFIFYNLPSFSMARLISYANKNNIKTFSDCTEWYEVTDAINLKNLIKKIDVKLRMEYYHIKVSGVISISRYLYDYYLEKNVKTILIPPLVDLEDFKWIKESKIKEFFEPVKFVYVGSPFAINDGLQVKSAKDRIDIVIDSLYQFFLKGEKFVFNIIGLTKENFIMAYPSFTNKVSEMEEVLVFKGRVPHLQAISLLKESNYSIFFRDNSLSNNAGFPTKFTEAITASTAVITNNSSNIDEFLKDGKNGFLLKSKSTKDVDKILDKVFKLNMKEQAEIELYTKNNNNIFDYRNYLNKVRDFIEN